MKKRTTKNMNGKVQMSNIMNGIRMNGKNRNIALTLFKLTLLYSLKIQTLANPRPEIPMMELVHLAGQNHFRKAI